MYNFKILAQSPRSRARVGVITTPHGDIETPSFIPVATRATIRLLDSAEIDEVGSQALICNTYHLHIAPGAPLIKKMGGLHTFMRWNKPLFTDSGGFQVYSLGFGSDHGMGKILKKPTGASVERDATPINVKIEDEGVRFRSPIDGTELFLGPRESIKIQENLGADIMFAFDECPSPLADRAYMLRSLEKTHRWAKLCLRERRSKGRALFGIVQGGRFSDLRVESARAISALDFEGFGIGGEFGYDKRSLEKIVSQTTDALPREKPRHLLGVGHPEDFDYLARAGIDTFDCIAPTHYARRGTVFTSRGRLDLRKALHLKDKRPIDPACRCDMCQTYTRSYVSHLLRANELTGMKLATFHNLHFFNALAAHVRKKIKKGEL